MAGKRLEIVEKYLSRRYLNQNPVGSNVEYVLDKLDFKQDHLEGNWSIFCRGHNEFAAIYCDKEFLVKGICSKSKILGNDLRTIDNIFNESWLSRKIRGNSLGLASLPSLLYAGSIGGVVAYDKSTNSKSIEATVEYLSALTQIEVDKLIGLTVAGGFVALFTASLAGVVGASSLINRSYASTLSDEAESYDYGKEAENSLGREFLFEKAKSGKISKHDFLKHFDRLSE